MIKQDDITWLGQYVFFRMRRLKSIDHPTSDPFKSAYHDPGKAVMERELTSSTRDSPIEINTYIRNCTFDRLQQLPPTYIPSFHCNNQCKGTDKSHVDLEKSAKADQDSKQL
mmetsp:Transcript_8976/g.13226  ORF Transcript_8976/g.13226 Transcript_8976/m.13226 type:complete len:112 (-) Transcript_8976:163-498(-)